MTGHRTLPDESEIMQGVDLAMHQIELAHGPKPLTILSPLASGADQLVAHRVLSRPCAELVVPLPMSLDEYLDDFPPGAARDAFLQLHAQAVETFTLPPSASRVEAYEAVGHYIVKHSDVLIAIWDGKPSRGRGGTAEVVALARRRNLPLAWIRAVNQPERTVPPLTTARKKDIVCYERFPPVSSDG